MEAEEPKKQDKTIYFIIAGVAALIVLYGIVTILEGGGISSLTEPAEPTRVRSMSQRLRRALDESNLKRTTVIDGTLTIEWEIAENLSESLAGRGARNDIIAMMKELKIKDPDFDEFDKVVFIGEYNGQQAVYAAYEWRTINGLNLNRVISDDIYKEADEVVNRPSFQD